MTRSCQSAWISLALILTAPALPAWADGPRLKSPSDAATDVGMYHNLLWGGGVARIDPQLAHYRTQIAENQNFDPVLADDTVEIARHVPAKQRLAPSSSFRWRVQRVDTRGQAGPWSESRRATVADFLGPQNENLIEVFAANSVDQARQKFAQTKKMPAAAVRLVEDVRWGNPTQVDIFSLKDYQNLWFDGNGKSIVITHPAQRVFHVLDSRNVVISDFELDFDPLPYGVVEVTELRPEANELVVSAITEGEAGLAFDDPQMIAAPREHMRQVDIDHPGRVAYAGRHTFKTVADKS